MDMKTKRVHLALCIAMIFVLVAITLGCGSSIEGYTKFTLREGAAHFSFEYSESYKERLVRVEFGYTDVGFHHSLPDDNETDSLFGVTVYEEGQLDIRNSARIALEWTISNLSGRYEDFQLLERSTVSIHGVEGELLVCSFTPTEEPDDYDPFWQGPELLLRRHVFFDYDGLIWDIWILSHEDRVEADETVWEHLLETFQILD